MRVANVKVRACVLQLHKETQRTMHLDDICRPWRVTVARFQLLHDQARLHRYRALLSSCFLESLLSRSLDLGKVGVDTHLEQLSSLGQCLCQVDLKLLPCHCVLHTHENCIDLLGSETVEVANLPAHIAAESVERLFFIGLQLGAAAQREERSRNSRSGRKRAGQQT